MAKYGFNIRISILEYEFEASKGNFSTREQKNMRKLRQDAGKQGECLTLESSGELTKLKDHYFKQQNDENLLFITEKNNKLNKILIEGVFGKQVCCRVCVFLFLLVSAR